MKRTLYSLLLTLLVAIFSLQTAQAGRMYDPEVSRFLSIDPILHETSPLELQKMHGGKFYSNSPYAYVFNNPIKFTDPDGRNPVLIAWAVFEIGMAIYDAYDVYTTLKDPNASNLEKGVSVAGAALGALLPGGGYSAADDVVEGGIKAGKALSKADDALKSSSDEIIDVFRVYGDEAKPAGFSWTPVDPSKIENFRDAAGLPNVNSGQFVIEGSVKKSDIINSRTALPLDGNKGGLKEFIIDPKKVEIKKVSGVNPDL